MLIWSFNKERKELSNNITSIHKTNDKLMLQKSKMDDNKNFKMKITNFINDKEDEKVLRTDVKNLMRKQEVIQAKYDESLKFLKKMDKDI